MANKISKGPLLVAILLFSTFTLAQASPDAIDQYVQGEMQKLHIPGVALLIARDGKIVRAQGYGLSNVELQVPVKPETVFQSGSLGKQFAATAVMMLVEEGKIKLDDPLTKYFKEAPATWNQVTVRQLLSHTAGFGDYPANFDFHKEHTEEETFKIIQRIPLAYPPGTKYSYSNMGYVTVGVLIHRVTGKFYGDFLQERIFQPLGMSTTRIISEADIIPNRAGGYRLVKGQLKNQDWVAPSVNTTADGSLYFSILDLAKWDAALYGDKLLKPSSLEQMWTVAKLNDGKPNPGDYGFGWDVGSKGHLVEHGGAWQGFNTYIARYRDAKLTVVVLTNMEHCDPGKIAHRVAEMSQPDLRAAN
jgi:CubicO group peptidase (beta-lactamase class C family)